MAQIETLRRRIHSTKGIQQTTRAMQLVDATKLRKSQQASAKSKAYIEVADTVLRRLNAAAGIAAAEVPLMRRRPVKRVVLVAIAADRGLAGAYNHAISRRLRLEVAHYIEQGVHVDVMAVGGRLINQVNKMEDIEVIGRYLSEEVSPTSAAVSELANVLVTMYSGEATDSISMIYTKSHSALSQEVVTVPLWPYSGPAVQESSDAKHAGVVEEFEPSPAEVLNAALARLLTASLLHAFQEARVSEHAMRMLAMRNATDNADELIDKLTLEVNTARQAAITQELSEITGAVAAMEE